MSGWTTQKDSLFGDYRERVLHDFRGECWLCRQMIDGSARERERGGTSWFVHPGDCPRPERKKKG